jgi:enamine deaminase RidA (YjgF/YER057c/UK114 family)
MAPEARLRELGIELPVPPPAIANYIGAVQVDRLVFLSGHGPMRGREHLFVGKLGQEFDIAEGQQAARLTALNMLATLRQTIGTLDRVKRVVKLLCFVNSTVDFDRQPLVANGASDLLVDVFGPDCGPHARAAVGMVALPFGIAVEIESVFEVE